MIAIIKFIARLAIDLIVDVIMDGIFNIIGATATVIACTTKIKRLSDVVVPEWLLNK